MNRLVPLITRPVRSPWIAPVTAPAPLDLPEMVQWLEDIRLFALGWVSGLVVFGTFLF